MPRLTCSSVGGSWIQAAGIAPAVPTRRDERAQTRQPNLPAVVVAGEHQVEVVGPGQVELVGRMGEENAECGLRIAECGMTGAEPNQGSSLPASRISAPLMVSDS